MVFLLARSALLASLNLCNTQVPASPKYLRRQTSDSPALHTHYLYPDQHPVSTSLSGTFLINVHDILPPITRMIRSSVCACFLRSLCTRHALFLEKSHPFLMRWRRQCSFFLLALHRDAFAVRSLSLLKSSLGPSTKSKIYGTARAPACLT